MYYVKSFKNNHEFTQAICWNIEQAQTMVQIIEKYQDCVYTRIYHI